MADSNQNTNKRQVFIIGCKGIPAAYGGFETFVEELTANRIDENIQYNVACMGDHSGSYTHNNARCFSIKVPDIGAAKAVYYDIAATRFFIKYCKENNIEQPIFYILACRIGPFIKGLAAKIKALGGSLYVNPDGHEWMRRKWNALIRRYWKYSEKLMVKHADLLICDSRNIESYIQKEYAQFKPNTCFIAYGSYTDYETTSDDEDAYERWLSEKGLTKGRYYLIVGRFVPENNFMTVLKEFMESNSDKDLAVITTANDKLYNELERTLHVSKDPRVKFVGTIYNQGVLRLIRENAYGYFHGHEVGGTNPSLLEALGSTSLNLLLDVGFNREVGEDGALYWNKEPGNLKALIESADEMPESEIAELGRKAHDRITEHYSWNSIVSAYERLFAE